MRANVRIADALEFSIRRSHDRDARDAQPARLQRFDECAEGGGRDPVDAGIFGRTADDQSPTATP
jgi:hypothetical protein